MALVSHALLLLLFKLFANRVLFCIEHEVVSMAGASPAMQKNELHPYSNETCVAHRLSTGDGDLSP